MSSDSENPKDDSEEEHANPFDEYDMAWPLYGDEEQISFGELLLTIWDMVAAHRASKTLTEDIWNLVKSVVPEGTEIGSYNIAEAIVRAHIKDAVVVCSTCTLHVSWNVSTFIVRWYLYV